MRITVSALCSVVILVVPVLVLSLGASRDKVLMAQTTIELDYGDAPATFPVVSSNNGARHSIHRKNELRLGALVDDETDGQPTSNATGDDVAGIDDEDGVEFIGALYRCMEGRVRVVSHVQLTSAGPNVARINAWVDFNGNGSWSREEKIINNEVARHGAHTYMFIVPCNAAIAAHAATRFRISTEAALDPYDTVPSFYPDGEVEDHDVAIKQIHDLKIVASDRPDPVYGNGIVAYDIEVHNLAFETSTGVTLAFTLPQLTTPIAADRRDGGACNVGQVVTCDIGTLAGNRFWYLTIRAMAPTGPQALEAWGSVTGNEIEVDTLNNRVIVYTAVEGGASPTPTPTPTAITPPVTGIDLAISNRSLPSIIGDFSDQFSYELVAQNRSMITAHSVEIVDVLPVNAFTVGLRIMPMDSSWSCSTFRIAPTLGIRCRAPAMAPGAEAKIYILLNGALGDWCDRLVNSASIASVGAEDVNPSNNAVAATTDLGCSDLRISKTVDDYPSGRSYWQPGEEFTYTLTITNAGMHPATAVTVFDTLPDEVEFVSLDHRPSYMCELSPSGGVVSCDIPNLDVGIVRSIKIRVKGKEGVCGFAMNSSRVNATLYRDPDMRNNHDLVFTKIGQCTPTPGSSPLPLPTTQPSSTAVPRATNTLVPVPTSTLLYYRSYLPVTSRVGCF